MNPHQKNKIDISSLSEEEQKLFRLYGKLPNKKDLFQNKLKERKYFDSGDYALSKAGKASDVGVTQIGSQHPSPESIPHLASPTPNGNGNGNNGNNPAPQPGQNVPSGSPVKESSFLHRETSMGQSQVAGEDARAELDESVSPPPYKEGVPIRGV
ncbi:MAG: hypothetical protein M1819_005997 [Sarea resinae]|nr:MAG: hypothetical protein M1819_005997 [Sarea resinae]